MPLRIHPIRHAKEVVCLETPLNSDGLDIPHYRLHLIAIYNRVILDIEGLHMTTNHPSASVCDFECVDTRGDPFPLNQFAGQPFLIVNTASLCSFSSQFKGLENIWQRYKDKGLIVLGMPSNDFGRQEPGNSAEIVSLCTTKFGVTFPILAKSHIAGEKAHPLFQWIAQEGGFFARPRWNFYKYIIGRDGHLQEWFSSLTSPNTMRFNAAISKAIIK
jgi:glutathione peroxidase